LQFTTENKLILIALIKCQSELKSITFDAINPHFKAKYLTLAGIQDFTRQILFNNDLAVIQSIEFDEQKSFVQTCLVHSSGQMISFNSPLIIGKNDMQGLGSAITYAKRYALSSLLSISGDDEDDDANLAVKQKPSTKAEVQKVEDPLDFVLNLGSIKNKKLGELDEQKLRDVRAWLGNEIKKDPKGPKTKFYQFACGQIEKVLKKNYDPYKGDPVSKSPPQLTVKIPVNLQDDQWPPEDKTQPFYENPFEEYQE